MSTIRAAIVQALRLLRAAAPGDEAGADELALGLEAARELILEIHEARGPLHDLDVPGPLWPRPPWRGRSHGGDAPILTVCPGENQRLRIQAGSTVRVALPNSVSMRGTRDPYDYGFDPGGLAGLVPQVGSMGAADGVSWRPPADGARIEIVGTRQGLFFYRADTNAWMAATGVALDGEQPLNQRLQGAFAALLAERLADVLAADPAPTPAQKARLMRAREQIFSQTGRHHAPVRARYF